MSTGLSTQWFTNWRRLVAAAFLSTGVAACGGGTPEVAVTLSEYSFEPNRVSIARAQKTAIKLTNKGTVDHFFRVPQLNVTSPAVAPGKTVVLELAVPRGGAPLRIVCTVPGHAEAGMVGELVVVDRPR